GPVSPSDPPPGATAGAGGDAAGGPPDPLEALSEGIRSAQRAAERLLQEASGSSGAPAADAPTTGAPPRTGYASPGPGAEDRERAELRAVAALLDLARSIVPAEMRAQIVELVREVLLLARAVIDWYLERLELRRRPPVEVEDITIS